MVFRKKAKVTVLLQQKHITTVTKASNWNHLYRPRMRAGKGFIRLSVCVTVCVSEL